MRIIRKKPILSAVVIVLVVIILLLVIFGGSSAKPQTLTVTRTDFINEITVSGKVIAAQTAELGFDQSGRISAIYAAVGDTVKSGAMIASIENGTVRADLAQKEATLDKERAKLAALQRGTRAEELAGTEQKYIDASSALVIAMRNAYMQTNDAILNKADSLFTNGNLNNPEITIRTQSYSEKRAIENERVSVGEQLKKWNTALGTLGGSNATSSYALLSSIRSTGSAAISSAKTFLDHLSFIAGNLTPANSGADQSAIDTYRSTAISAGQQAGSAASSEQEAYGAWSSAYKSLVLDQSGSSAEDIAAQNAQVKSAAADVSNALAQLRKTIITAPFDGIVTKIDLKIGEIASPSDSRIAMMSSGVFEVESYIPEVNIAQVKIGDPASITLDAYGTETDFSASVIGIDPAETLKDGVSTYKTRLLFSENDTRIKSGMTATIHITTEKKSGVISIPRSAVTKRNGGIFVNVVSGDGTIERAVTTGSVTNLGKIEITSGLEEGEIIALPSAVTP